MTTITEDIRTTVGLGAPLTVTQVAEVLELDQGAVLASCDELIDSGLLVDGPEGLTLGGDLPEVSNARKGLLAERLAGVLESAGAGPDRLGRLWLVAGRHDRAFPLLAGAALGTVPDDLTAIEVLGLAFDAAPHDADPDTIGRLHVARAGRLRNAGRTDEALEDIDQAIRILTGEPKVDALAFAATLADDQQLSQEAERWAAMGELEAERIGAHAKLGSLLGLHARELARLGFAQEAATTQQRAHALVEAHGSEVQRFYSLVNAARLALDAGDVRQAAPAYERLIDTASKIEGSVSVADKQAHFARAALLGGRVSEGLVAADSATRIATEEHAVAPAFLADIALVEGMLAFHRPAEALEAADRVVTHAETSLPAWRNRALGYRAASLIELGRADEARADLDRALELTPRGADGLRLRSWLEARRLAIGATPWPQTEAEDLTDQLLQSGWHQTAAQLMVVRARQEDDPDLAGEAAALAYRLGQPMLAADAIQAGDGWSEPGAAAVADRLREVERNLPAEWVEAWKELPAVVAGLAIDGRNGTEEAEALRESLDRAMATAGLTGETVLSPSQRRDAGLVRRAPRVRSVARILAATIGVAAIAVVAALGVVEATRDDPPPPTTTAPTTTTLPPLLERTVPIPDGGLAGSAPFGGGPGRSGSFEGSFEGPPTGVYWTKSLGGFVRATPVIRGNTIYVGTSEDRMYAISLPRGTTTFESDAEGGVEEAATPAQVVGFGEGGQSEDMVFYGSAGGVVYARTLGDSGNIVWEYQTGGPIVDAPLVTEDTVYIASADGWIYSFGAVGGEERGRYPGGEAIAGGFDYGIAADDQYLYAVGGGDLHMIELATLEPVCVVDLPGGTELVTAPTVADGAVYVGSATRNIVVRAAGNCGAPPAGASPSHQIDVVVTQPAVIHDGTLWAVADALLLKLDPISAQFLAVPTDVGGVITTTPVVAGGTVYVAIDTGELVAIDAATGEVEWVEDLGSEIRAAPAVVDGVIVVVTVRGDLIALADR